MRIRHDDIQQTAQIVLELTQVIIPHPRSAQQNRSQDHRNMRDDQRKLP